MIKHLPRNEDLNTFKELISIINSNKCVAFVGAGVSVNKGYRPWIKLIFDKKKSHGIEGLLEYAGLFESDVDGLDYPKIMDLCKEKIGVKKYRKFIRREYERKNTEISENHSLICKINFKYIITTNFDPCLYDNAESTNQSRLVVYPGDSLEILKGKTLYHIHGRAFLKKGEKSSRLNRLIDSLVFGEKAFNRAYDTGLEIKLLLYQITKMYKLCFLGFSMADPIFIQTLKAVIAARKQFLDEYMENHRLEKNGEDGIGYIFLEYPVDSVSKLSTRNLKEEEKRKLISNIDEFNNKEKEMNGLGIKVIGFNRIDDNYSGLTTIIQKIKNEATMIGLQKPLEISDAESTASTSGV